MVKRMSSTTRSTLRWKPMFCEGEGRLAIVVRIRGINQCSPKVKKTLRLLRLRQIHNAVFVRLNKATMEKLRHFNEGGE